MRTGEAVIQIGSQSGVQELDDMLCIFCIFSNKESEIIHVMDTWAVLPLPPLPCHFTFSENKVLGVAPFYILVSPTLHMVQSCANKHFQAYCVYVVMVAGQGIETSPRQNICHSSRVSDSCDYTSKDDFKCANLPNVEK